MLENFIKEYVEIDKKNLEKLYDNEQEIHDIMYSSWMVIEACEKFLEKTDYVIIKMSEEQMLGKSIDELNNKYKEIIESRKQARMKINELNG